MPPATCHEHPLGLRRRMHSNKYHLHSFLQLIVTRASSFVFYCCSIIEYPFISFDQQAIMDDGPSSPAKKSRTDDADGDGGATKKFNLAELVMAHAGGGHFPPLQRTAGAALSRNARQRRPGPRLRGPGRGAS